MEGSCSTGQSPQRAVVSVEEEEEEEGGGGEEEEEGEEEGEEEEEEEDILNIFISYPCTILSRSSAVLP
jgi:hypothetical protein